MSSPTNNAINTSSTTISINGIGISLGGSGTVPAAAGTLTGATLASGVTASSLTSFGASIALGTPASGTLTNCTGFNSNSLTGTTLNSGITASSLTSTGTLTGLTVTNGTSNTNINVTSAGTNTYAYMILNRSTASNGGAYVSYQEAASEKWVAGMLNGDSKYHINYSSGSGDALVIDTSLNVNIPSLTASRIVSTDASKNLTSTATTGSGNVALATGTNSYTPTLGDGTTNFTMTTQNGAYKQIGAITFFWAHVDWSSKNGVTAAIRFSLPVTFTATDIIGFTIGYASGMPSGAFLLANGNTSNAYADFHKIVSGTTSNLTAADLAASGGLYISGWYY